MPRRAGAGPTGGRGLVKCGATPRDPFAWARHSAGSRIKADAMMALASASTLRSAEILMGSIGGCARRGTSRFDRTGTGADALAARNPDRSGQGRRAAGRRLASRPGRSAEVGKSRLMNALAALIARSSPQHPGRLATSSPLRPPSMAGRSNWPTRRVCGRTDDPIEAEGVARARNRQRLADLVLVVLDRSEPLTDADLAILPTIQSPWWWRTRRICRRSGTRRARSSRPSVGWSGKSHRGHRRSAGPRTTATWLGRAVPIDPRTPITCDPRPAGFGGCRAGEGVDPSMGQIMNIKRPRIVMVSGNAPPALDGVADSVHSLMRAMVDRRPDWSWSWVSKRPRWFRFAGHQSPGFSPIPAESCLGRAGQAAGLGHGPGAPAVGRPCSGSDPLVPRVGCRRPDRLGPGSADRDDLARVPRRVTKRQAHGCSCVEV